MSETTPDVKNLHVVDGPLSRHKLAVLRDERTTTADFRQAMKELALILVGAATGNMPTRQVQIRTPLTGTAVEKISGPVCLVPVLRAGLGMLDGALALLPTATVGFMGLQRDEETAEPIEYYVNLPRNLDEYLVLVPPRSRRGARRRAPYQRAPRRELLRRRRRSRARRPCVHRPRTRRRRR